VRWRTSHRGGRPARRWREQHHSDLYPAASAAPISGSSMPASSSASIPESPRVWWRWSWQTRWTSAWLPVSSPGRAGRHASCGVRDRRWWSIRNTRSHSGQPPWRRPSCMEARLSLMEEGTNLRAYVDRLLSTAGVAEQVTMELDNVEAIKKMIERASASAAAARLSGGRGRFPGVLPRSHSPMFPPRSAVSPRSTPGQVTSPPASKRS